MSFEAAWGRLVQCASRIPASQNWRRSKVWPHAIQTSLRILVARGVR